MELVEKLLESICSTENNPVPYFSESSRRIKILTAQSWIRKIARKSGFLPKSFLIDGVKKINDDPVACGGFADVYMGKLEERPVALKVMRFFGTNENGRLVNKSLSHEALLWKHLQHPYILPFMGICRDQFIPRLVLVSPWMKNRDILTYLEDNPDKDRLLLLSQCAVGLKYLHGLDPALLHGDIKACNILIDDDENARLADFGLLSISETQNFDTTFQDGEPKGTLRWMAPELFKPGEKKSRASDVYAFGMTMIEIYTGKPPFAAEGYSDIQVMMAVSTGTRHSRINPSSLRCPIPDKVWEMIDNCQKEAKERPSAEQISDELDSMCSREKLETSMQDLSLKSGNAS